VVEFAFPLYRNVVIHKPLAKNCSFEELPMADVLIVDDDLDSRAILETIVGLLHVSSDSSETATDALTFLSSPTACYRLILSDLALPGHIDGLELIRLIRANPRYQTIPCLAITAFDLPHLRTQALQAGFNAYYVKPIDPPAFLEILRPYLA
jgi:CheY-like chemotaxis protein